MVRLIWRHRWQIIFGLVSMLLLSAISIELAARIRWFRLTPAERLLAEADELAKKANWRAADPLYKQAESMFREQRNGAMELYARASQIPAASEASTQPLSFWLAEVTRELTLPEARDSRTKLRLLEIKGQLENNYDATLAYNTWRTVQQLAAQQHNWTVENRAYGEEAIGLFLLGDTAGARKHAFRSYTQAWLLRDREGRLRLASLIGAGMVQFKAYEGALPYLNTAISIAQSIPDTAYPNIAVTAKVDALRGLKRYSEGLALCAEAMRVPQRDHLKGHLYQVLSTRASVWEDLGDLAKAKQDYAEAFEYARELGYWRGLTETGGPLARAYEGQNDLSKALSVINEALGAQHQIPSEMYFAPRNLAIKAEILKRLGRIAESNNLYERSLALVDSLLITAPTPTLVHRIVDEYAGVYSGYFSSLCQQGNLPGAFAVIERAYGRVEQLALQNQRHVPPHSLTPQERELTTLNLKLISTEDEGRREELLSKIAAVEDQLDFDPWSHSVATRPVPLVTLQNEIRPGELVIEYVLADPRSYALAITRESMTPYALPARNAIQMLVRRYISVLAHQKSDKALAKKVFDQLLQPVSEFANHSSVIIVPNGDLHLLPFTALYDGTQYVVATHATSVVSAGTVLHMLRSRDTAVAEARKPFIGFAPWADERQLKASEIFTVFRAWRGVTGPKRSELVPLPESKHEIITARDEVDKLEGALPTQDQIKIGPEATEVAFKRLPLATYQVLHLAVHGYADIEHPDRSALVFAHDPREQSDDGLLQIREIRSLRLNSSLVILSACKTALGPADEGGVANIANAFLQAGARTVVSSFWPVSDHASSQFMELFYAHLANRETKSEALRKAAIASLRSGLPPYYWASFEISGDPDESLISKN
jgi:CHAT domain-containing protein